MSKSSKSRAEQKFTATQKKAERAQKETVKAEHERMAHMAKLRALRLAKEAEDAKLAAKKKAAKK